MEKLNDRFFALMARGDGASGQAQLFLLYCTLLICFCCKLTRLIWGIADMEVETAAPAVEQPPPPVREVASRPPVRELGARSNAQRGRKVRRAKG